MYQKIKEFEIKYDLLGKGEISVFIECEVEIEIEVGETESGFNSASGEISYSDCENVKLVRIFEITAYYYDVNEELVEIENKRLTELKKHLISNEILLNKL